MAISFLIRLHEKKDGGLKLKKKELNYIIFKKVISSR